MFRKPVRAVTLVAILLAALGGCRSESLTRRYSESTPTLAKRQDAQTARAGVSRSGDGESEPRTRIAMATHVAELPEHSGATQDVALEPSLDDPNLPEAIEPDEAIHSAQSAVPTEISPTDGSPNGSANEAVPEMAELRLDVVINATLNANPDLVSASEQIGRAEAVMERARAEFFPRLGIRESFGVTNNPTQAFMYLLNQSQLDPTMNFNSPGAQDDFHTELALSHQVYNGGRRQHEYCAAAAQRDSAVHNLAAVQNQLVFHSAEAYYRLIQADVLVGVREEAVKQVEQHLKIVESRYRNESAVKSDVLTVEVRLAEVKEALISARNQLELAWSILENVTGCSITRRPLPQHVMEAPWSDEVDRVEEFIIEAQSMRPELGVLAGQRQAAAEGACAAATGKRPAADFVASYDVFTGDFQRGNDSYFVGLVFSLNLFDGGRTDMDVAQATARVRELRAKERRLLLDIELDVRKSHLALDDSRQRLEVATQAIGQAEESLREIEVRYRGKAATISELVDSQVALSNARVRQANAEAQVEIARASLQRAVGRLADSM